MKSLLPLVMLLVLISGAVAGTRGVIEAPNSCQLCRMDRTKFAQSRMLVVYADGQTVGVCSIHCAVAEMIQNKHRQIRTLQVADFTSKELADVRSAIWIVGGKMPGVMTALPKWAFTREEEARAFLREYGGKITPLGQVINLAGDEIMEMANVTLDLSD
jgi:nitrous oxide reductase accessory protein NosL